MQYPKKRNLMHKLIVPCLSAVIYVAVAACSTTLQDRSAESGSPANTSPTAPGTSTGVPQGSLDQPAKPASADSRALLY